MAQPQSTATTTLILSIVGWACCQLISPYTAFRAKNELAEISSGMRPESDRTMTIISLVLSILGCLILVGWILYVIFGGGVVLLALLSGGGR